MRLYTLFALGSFITASLCIENAFAAPSTVGDAPIPQIESLVSNNLSAGASVSDGVFTYRYNNARDGHNPNEVILTPANVASSNFKKVRTFAVDGAIYAQPLYAKNVATAKGNLNLIFIATEHNSVYAFDADLKIPGPIWKTNFNVNGATPVPARDTQSTEIIPEIGITSTPVIDPATGMLYTVAYTKRTGKYYYHLHALDITNGKEPITSPRSLDASVPGTGEGNEAGQVWLRPLHLKQRTALSLSKGLITIAFASHEDVDPYHGWVLAYDAKTLRQVAKLNVTPNTQRAGIWMSGDGPAIDGAGNLYLATSNGGFEGKTEFGDTVLKLTPNLKVLDYFSPRGQLSFDDNKDLGSGGIMLFTTPGGLDLVVQGGKLDSLYFVKQASFGDHSDPLAPMAPYQVIEGVAGASYGTPAYFNNIIYTHGAHMVLKAFKVQGNSVIETPISEGAIVSGNPGVRLGGTSPVVSSNGLENGIVWELNNDGWQTNARAILYAYDAKDLSKLLYSSSALLGDRAGPSVKFTAPLVIDGKVFIGNNKQVTVYALRN